MNVLNLIIDLESCTHVGSVTRVAGADVARNSHRGAQAAATASDTDLSAADVELGDTRGPGVVDAELLDAEQVVAIGHARREGEGVALCGINGQMFPWTRQIFGVDSRARFQEALPPLKVGPISAILAQPSPPW